MTMSNEEIARDYRLSKVPMKQIGILAELNQCDKKTIVEILRQEGESLPARYQNVRASKPKLPPGPAPDPAPETLAKDLEVRLIPGPADDASPRQAMSAKRIRGLLAQFDAPGLVDVYANGKPVTVARFTGVCDTSSPRITWRVELCTE